MDGIRDSAFLGAEVFAILLSPNHYGRRVSRFNSQVRDTEMLEKEMLSEKKANMPIRFIIFHRIANLIFAEHFIRIEHFLTYFFTGFINYWL